MNKRRPFIPKDKPKSWVVGISSALVGLLVAGPITFLGSYLGLTIITAFGAAIFVVCWVAFVVTWFIFAFGLLKGKYHNMQEREWGEQIW